MFSYVLTENANVTNSIKDALRDLLTVSTRLFKKSVNILNLSKIKSMNWLILLSINFLNFVIAFLLRQVKSWTLLDCLKVKENFSKLLKRTKPMSFQVDKWMKPYWRLMTQMVLKKEWSTPKVISIIFGVNSTNLWKIYYRKFKVVWIFLLVLEMKISIVPTLSWQKFKNKTYKNFSIKKYFSPNCYFEHLKIISVQTLFMKNVKTSIRH